MSPSQHPKIIIANHILPTTLWAFEQISPDITIELYHIITIVITQYGIYYIIILYNYNYGFIATIKLLNYYTITIVLYYTRLWYLILHYNYRTIPYYNYSS